MFIFVALIFVIPFIAITLEPLFIEERDTEPLVSHN
jgi:hypothetical protein